MRLLSFLKEHCEEAPSVKAIKRAIDAKRCTVNGSIQTFSSFTVSENDVVILDLSAFSEQKEQQPPSILYEDEALLICNKPPGLTSEKASLRKRWSYFQGTWELVHRLDKETSGALIIAKSSAVKKQMVAQFKQLKVRKAYLALVHGVVKKTEGKIENFLGPLHAYQGQTLYGAVSKEKGKKATTLWKCLQNGKKTTLLWCEPLTGRTHQLRVHLSGIGHPILGDTQYGKRALSAPRHLLHAYQLQFEHPLTGRPLKITAPIPTDFREFMNF